MKKLLIIHWAQFGYHTDIYKWCQYLHDKYIIDVVCFDFGENRYIMDNVTVHYVSKQGFKYFRAVHFLISCIYYASKFKGIVLVCYFYGCHWIKKILPHKYMVMDIRSFCVLSDETKRNELDNVILKAAQLFDYVTVISEGLRLKLPKDADHTAVLPLGADFIDTKIKTYNRLDLLYIGTFYNRNLEKTIEGFAIALKKNKNEVQLHYHIVGKGIQGEEIALKMLVEKYQLSDYISFYGYLPHDKLNGLYEKCNIGVSFVPITPYYDYQPVTKTFEYVMAGLYTIATATISNKKVITPNNGIIIDDTSESFANAILKIIDIRNELNSCDIKKTFAEYQWCNIVNNVMVNILETIEERN